MPDLKRCPFCGGKASYRLDGGVTCENNCFFTGWHEFLTKSEAYWNTRPIEDALQKRIAELEAAARWVPVGEWTPEECEPCLVMWNPDRVSVGMWHWDNEGDCENPQQDYKAWETLSFESGRFEPLDYDHMFDALRPMPEPPTP